jgi:hypothetical protein
MFIIEKLSHYFALDIEYGFNICNCIYELKKIED